MKIPFRKKSKNNRKKKTLLVQYNPPEWLNSAEVWLILYRRSDPISIISLIYKRIWDWLISVDSQDTTNYTIRKTKEISDIAPSYELLFWKSFLGSCNNIEIDDKSDLDLEWPLKSLEEYWYAKWWFTKSNSIDTQNLSIMWIIIVLIILLFITPHSEEKDGLMNIIILISFFILFLFPKLWIIVGIDLPKFRKMKTTKKGDELIYHILWFKKFLETCDTNILRTFLKKDPLYFDKILPYAIIFWIESELIEKFRPLIDEFGLKLYIYQFKNPLYNTLHQLAEDSIPIKTWDTKIINNNWNTSNNHDIWFSSWSSFKWWWRNFSKWWGWWGGGWKSW